MAYRKHNEKLKTSDVKSTIKYGGGNVIVWECTSAICVGKLIFIDITKNAISYLNTLKTSLKKCASKMSILQTFKFYQDNKTLVMIRVALLCNC